MFNPSRFYPLLLLLLVVFVAGCDDDDDPVIPNEEEVITDLTLTLTPNIGGPETVVFTFKDADGDGGQAPQITSTGTLAPNTTYTGSLELLNASDPTNVESITAEIQEEDEEHQFFFQVAGGLNLTFAYADADDDGNPLGLVTTVNTGASSSGNFTVILRHEPNKTAAGISINNPAPAGGETDIEVTFQASF
ncbi:type 1 periplasmic binding fold superfamily protein [Neolewinella lacunae]|uniref:Type 1 periplasmic binding fold superfamily protein n=1 Tax=Neolewinella lacunae TaxID=1517758 RepID=A0A923T814_9BACT|nr:type 1 periplasmic binding fold superfamily protein [Neolewinella lacunae]MBC6995125.1 type 1 periplasmic binding fold superfamily protein [Neolewinella lacunae]MDN3634075.1 type 1 periplasmic binding fold superfamily protein [Neolewinella lacunae]